LHRDGLLHGLLGRLAIPVGDFRFALSSVDGVGNCEVRFDSFGWPAFQLFGVSIQLGGQASQGDVSEKITDQLFVFFVAVFVRFVIAQESTDGVGEFFASVSGFRENVP